MFAFRYYKVDLVIDSIYQWPTESGVLKTSWSITEYFRYLFNRTEAYRSESLRFGHRSRTEYPNIRLSRSSNRIPGRFVTMVCFWIVLCDLEKRYPPFRFRQPTSINWRNISLTLKNIRPGQKNWRSRPKSEMLLLYFLRMPD